MTTPDTPDSTPAQPVRTGAAQSRMASLQDKLQRFKRPIMAMAAVGAVLGGVAGYLNAWRTVRGGADDPAVVAAPGATDAGPLSIVVLPFTNQTGDPQKAYIADGLTSSVTSDLSRLRYAFVVPVSTAAAYAHQAAPVKQIGQDLGVRYVLQAAVSVNGNRLRVNAQMADTVSGAQRWAETFEGDMGDLFALQDRITVSIGNTVGPEMTILAARESELRKTAPEVGDLFLRSSALRSKPATLSSYVEQERLLREVLAIEPRNARALRELADVLGVRYLNYPGADEQARQRGLAEASALSDQAMTLDPDGPQPLYMNALLAVARGEYQAAAHLFEREIVLHPKAPNPYIALAATYTGLMEPDKAIVQVNRALDLYPKGSDHAFSVMATAHFMRGDPAEAAAWAQRAIDTGTGLDTPHVVLVLSYAELGDEARVRAASTQLRQRFPALTAANSWLRPGPGVEAAASDAFWHSKRPAWRKAGLP